MKSVPAILAVAFGAAAAHAATFTTTSTADLPDLIPGNGFCNVFPQSGAGPCTLRAAIIEANALAGADVVVLSNDLPDGHVYTLALAGEGEDGAGSGDLDITDDLQIRFLASGERPVVDADGIDRAFDIIAGNVTLLGFDITGGAAVDALATSGGGVLVRSDAGAVTLSLMRVHGNTALLGGGLYNAGTDTSVLGCEFRDNEFRGDVNETASGSAIRNRGNLVIGYSSFTGNRGVPPVVLVGGAASGLSASANAIDSEPVGAANVLHVFDTTMASNTGNAINTEGAVALELSSVTLAGNTVRGLRVGGDGAEVLVHNSIIARNAFADCFISAGADLDADRYNLDSDDSCDLSGGTTNRAGVDPQLTPPAYHGGFTRAAWPVSSSIVVDHGHPLFSATGCEDEDQQFVDRPVDFDGDGAALCDIGAVELRGDLIFFDPFDRL